MKLSGLFLLIVFMVTNIAYSKDVRKGKEVDPIYNFNHPPSAEYYNPIPVAVVYENNDHYSGKSEISVPPHEADNTSNEEQKGKSFDLKYSLNHPPLPEEYSSIPVSVVFEDDNKYSGKSEFTPKTEQSDEMVKLGVKYNEKADDPTAKQEKDNTNTTITTSINNKGNGEVLARPRTLNSYEIPVAIVYESDSTSYNQKKKKETVTEESLKSRSSYTRKIKAGSNNENEQNIQASKPETKTLNPDSDTRVFMKRITGRDPVVPILQMESYVFSHNGNFHYSYEGGDGTRAFSEGRQKTVDDKAGEAVEGGFSYKDKEGNDFSLTYTADENGYRPVGAHLPTPPPIPPAIARALKYLATATPEPVTELPAKSKLDN